MRGTLAISGVAAVLATILGIKLVETEYKVQIDSAIREPITITVDDLGGITATKIGKDYRCYYSREGGAGRIYLCYPE